MIKFRQGSFAWMLLACSVGGYAQSSSGTIHGAVLDPSGAAIAGATVAILNSVSHYQVSVQANAQGVFQFANVPYNTYHLTASASGFQNAAQDVDVRSAVPVEVKVSLPVGVADHDVSRSKVPRTSSKLTRPPTPTWTAICSISCRSKVNRRR